MEWYLHISYEFFLALIWIIAFYLLIGRRIFNTINEWKTKKLSIETDILIRDTKYNETEIEAHLDYLIQNIIADYELLNITPKNIYYINNKLEKEIIDHVSVEVSNRISKALITQLSFIYNDEYIGAYLGSHIYMSVVNYVLDFNLRNHENNVQQNTTNNQTTNSEK